MILFLTVVYFEDANMKSNNQTISIVDDDMDVCNALRCLFESVNFNVQTYNSAHAFLESNYCHQQGCLIVDVRMPVMSGLELLEYLKLQKNRLPVIMISGYADIHMAIRAMKSGAVDFVLKPFNDQCLLEVAQKYTHLSINTNPSDKIHTLEHIQQRLDSLSPRERQVMNLIAEGKLNKEIAYLLSISMSTVEVHRANLMRKMQAKNLAQLIKFYLKFQMEMEFA